jgi:hypothetical protein
VTEDEKPIHRHSFVDPEKAAQSSFGLNRFGHTVLGQDSNNNVLPHDRMKVIIDESGNINASDSQSLIDHPAMQKFISDHVFPSEEPEADESEFINEDQYNHAENKSIFDNIPTTLSEFMEDSVVNISKEIAKKTTPPVQIAKDSINIGCASCGNDYPKNAKFCPHCGVSLIKFCYQCGYKFSGAEKFCPDCGERR